MAKKVKMSEAELTSLKERLENNELSSSDIKLLKSIVDAYFWLSQELKKKVASLRKIRSFFGFKSESSKNNKKDSSEDDKNAGHGNDKVPDEANSAAPAKEDKSPEVEQKPKNWDPKANHGRISNIEYTGCKQVNIFFDNPLLKEGICPNCNAYNTIAKVTKLKPKMVVVLEGTPLVTGTRYVQEYAKCNLCNQYFTASIPSNIAVNDKYLPSVYSTLAIHHYYGGSPFYRIQMLQEAQNIPLKDSTQYDLMNELYQNSVEPIVEKLTDFAAEGNAFLYDDSIARILEQVMSNKKKSTSTHATVLLSVYNSHKIFLFQTNDRVAGKVFEDIISNRTSNEDFTTMSDASNRNFPKLSPKLLACWIITLCLVHGRRNFAALMKNGDANARFVVEKIAIVYQNESYCKRHHLNDDERLEYHKKHSKPVMEALRIWFCGLLKIKEVEPNSELGKAIIYMLKRWKYLTRFLHVPGVEIDNNVTEQAVKVIIRYRNNSTFYKTFYGASIGDGMMSLIHTAAHCGANVFDYLNAIQIYSVQVNENPEAWMPWCYLDTIKKIEGELDKAA